MSDNDNKYQKINGGLLCIILILILLYSFYNTSCFFAICIINFLHLLVLLFVFIGPFVISTKSGLYFYIAIMIFIMIHWVLLNDTCCLTMLEQYVTGRKSEDTFIGKIVKPVYNITSREINIIAILLLIFAILKCIKFE